MGSQFQVKFFRGQTLAFVDLEIVDDQELETDETFITSLDSPIGGFIEDPSEAVITIWDDECKLKCVFIVRNCIAVFSSFKFL